MAPTSKRPKKTPQDALTKTTVRVGKALARSSATIEAGGRKARQAAKRLIAATVGSGTAPAPMQETPLRPNAAMTVEALIGFLAGDIYCYLVKHKGEAATADLFRAMAKRGNTSAYVCAALGWLAREYKIRFLDEGERIALAE